MRILHGHWNAAREARIITEHNDNGLELVYVRHGKVTWSCEDALMTVRAGELSFTWPWQTHAAVNQTLPPVDIYWVLLPLNTRKRPSSKALKGIHVDLILPQKIGYDLVQNLSRLEYQILKPAASFKEKFIQLVTQLDETQGQLDLPGLGWLYLVLDEVQAAIRAADHPMIDFTRERVERFLSEELPGSLEDVWTLERMSDACSLGRTTFAEQVKRLRGDTPVRVLTRMRIDSAKERLRNTSDPITRIAAECGFSTSQRFATVFKAYTGQAPREFRRLSPSSPIDE